MTTPADPVSERATLLRLAGVFRDRAEHELYLADGWQRIQVVLQILSGLRKKSVHRILELGSNPYMMTILMQRRFDFELELANYFEDGVNATDSLHVAELDGKRIEFPFRHFNIERNIFPYPDDSFDCVLFCEILEHLLVNPDHAVAEMSRVIRPGGYLVVSTPNATRLTNLFFLAMGRNIWDWYSANGPYGRHNREFTLAEVRSLLDRYGFDLVRADVQNIQPLARRFTYLQKLRPSVWYEHLFVVGERRANNSPAGQHASAQPLKSL